jgi:ATP-dependent helicase HrpB
LKRIPSIAPPDPLSLIQELFGLEETSHIAHYNQPPMLHLLSLTRSSVTQDLANFWCSTCVEVKKDLKSGNPKYFWPEDFLVAEAAARAKGRTAF